MSLKKTSIIVASSTAAVAATGAVAYVLKRRAPRRQAYRRTTGWTSAIPARPMPRSVQAHAPVGLPEKSSMNTSAANDTMPATHGPDKIDSADPKPTPGFFGAIKEIYYEFSNDDVMTQAAALAFYSGLAFAPLLTVAVWAMQIFYSDSGKEKVAEAFSQVVGQQAAQPLKELLQNTSAASGMTVAGMVSVVLVVFSASGVFGQVQSALNAIWHVAAKPSSGIMGFVRKRVLSMGMLASILFLLMTSLIVSVALQGTLKALHVTGAGAILGTLVNVVVSIGLFTLLFGALFRFVPDAKIGWKPVWVGGFISAILFAVGKFGLAIYIGRTDYSSSYGAATGSFVALLVWTYYSAIILLVGAEATEVYARRLGHQLEPDQHAVRIKQVMEGA